MRLPAHRIGDRFLYRMILKAKRSSRRMIAQASTLSTQSGGTGTGTQADFMFHVCFGAPRPQSFQKNTHPAVYLGQSQRTSDFGLNVIVELESGKTDQCQLPLHCILTAYGFCRFTWTPANRYILLCKDGLVPLLELMQMYTVRSARFVCTYGCLRFVGIGSLS